MLEPLRITAHLTCGVVSDRFLPLDGLLHYQLVRERHGAQDVSLPGRSAIRIGGLTLPLARLNTDDPQGRWYYACSFAEWPEGLTTEGQDHWNKRLDVSLCDLIDFRGRRGNVPIATGQYRSYHMPVFYRVAPYVRWYLVGNFLRLQQLLCCALGLGKKTSQGWGSVRRWDIEPWGEDWSVRGHGGRLMRAIPAEGGMSYGIRPSYWDPRHQVPCELPR